MINQDNEKTTLDLPVAVIMSLFYMLRRTLKVICFVYLITLSCYIYFTPYLVLTSFYLKHFLK